MALMSVDAYPEKLQRSAIRVLDSLDRIDDRTNDHYSTVRKHARTKFRGMVRIFVPDPEQDVVDPDNVESPRAWARSLSASGMSFIYPKELELTNFLAGLELPNGRHTWMIAEIVRKKQMAEEEFWEYGVKFRGRA